jgi:hypothetical protein
LFSICGKAAFELPPTYPLAPAYVPSGSSTVSLQNATGLAVGDDVHLNIFLNPAWMRAMWGGLAYPPMNNGTALKAWGPSLLSTVIRRIVGISGNQVTLDSPVTSAIPGPEYTSPKGAWLAPINARGWISQVRWISSACCLFECASTQTRVAVCLPNRCVVCVM